MIICMVLSVDMLTWFNPCLFINGKIKKPQYWPVWPYKFHCTCCFVFIEDPVVWKVLEVWTEVRRHKIGLSYCSSIQLFVQFNGSREKPRPKALENQYKQGTQCVCHRSKDKAQRESLQSHFHYRYSHTMTKSFKEVHEVSKFYNVIIFLYQL